VQVVGADLVSALFAGIHINEIASVAALYRNDRTGRINPTPTIDRRDAYPTEWGTEKEGKRWIPDFSGMTYGGEGKERCPSYGVGNN